MTPQFIYACLTCKIAAMSRSKTSRLASRIHIVFKRRCTRVKNPGEGVPVVFAKIPRWGVKAFRKNCQGVSPYFGFYCIFINKFFENLPFVCIYVFESSISSFTKRETNCLQRTFIWLIPRCLKQILI